MRTQISDARRRLLTLADNAPVQGPGTGTSDSIPARLSAGEFVLPADTVRKVGVKSLRDLIEQTHVPSGRPRHPARFADGGLVGEDAKKRQNAFGDLAAATSNPGVIQYAPNYGPAGYNPQARTVSQVAAEPAAPAQMGSNLTAVRQANADEVRNLSAQGNTAQAVGASMRGDLASVPAFLADVGSAIAKDAAPVVGSLGRFANGLLGGTPSATSADQASAKAVPDLNPAPANPTDQRLAAGTQQAPMDAAASPPTPSLSNNITKTVDANGRVTYSGNNIGPNATINGKEAGGGYMSVAPDRGPSAATSAALSGALSDAMARGDVGAVQQHYFNKGESFGGKTEQQVRADGLMAKAQNLLDRGHLGDAQKAQMLLTSLGAMEQNATNALREQNQNVLKHAELGLDARRQDEREKTDALDREKTGLSLEAERQASDLRKIIVDPTAAPEKQRNARERLMALVGKKDDDVWAHSPGGQVVDPKTQQLVTQPGTIYNRRTGETRADTAQAGQLAAPPSKESLVPGQVYTTPRGKAVWDGKQFKAV